MNRKDVKNVLILAAAAFSVIGMGIATYVFMAHVGKRYTESIVTYPKNGTEKSVFASNGKESYLCCSEGENFTLYFTDKDSFIKLPFECPENKRIIRMAVDDDGNCSMLIYSAESEMVDGALLSTLTGEATEIDVIDKNGEILSKTDVSAYLTNKNVPDSFATHDSIYYAMDCSGKAVVGSVLDGMGNVMSFDIEGTVTAVDDSKDEMEQQADKAAADALIPPEVWKDTKIQALLYTSDSDIVRKVAQEKQLSPAGLAGRLHWETGKYDCFQNLLGKCRDELLETTTIADETE